MTAIYDRNGNPLLANYSTEAEAAKNAAQWLADNPQWSRRYDDTPDEVRVGRTLYLIEDGADLPVGAVDPDGSWRELEPDEWGVTS